MNHPDDTKKNTKTGIYYGYLYRTGGMTGEEEEYDPRKKLGLREIVAILLFLIMAVAFILLLNRHAYVGML